MKNSKFLKNIIILLSLGIILMFVIHYFVFRDIKTRSLHISYLSRELLSRSDTQGYLITTERLIENMNSDLEKIDNYIIGSDGDVAFIETLESLARDNGLTIKIDSLLIENNPDLDSSNITTLRIKAKTNGPWSGAYKFLSQLESFPYKFYINSFSIFNETDIPSNEERPTVPGDDWQASFDIQVLKYK